MLSWWKILLVSWYSDVLVPRLIPLLYLSTFVFFEKFGQNIWNTYQDFYYIKQSMDLSNVSEGQTFERICTCLEFYLTNKHFVCTGRTCAYPYLARLVDFYAVFHEHNQRNGIQIKFAGNFAFLQHWATSIRPNQTTLETAALELQNGKFIVDSSYISSRYVRVCIFKFPTDVQKSAVRLFRAIKKKKKRGRNRQISRQARWTNARGKAKSERVKGEKTGSKDRGPRTDWARKEKKMRK